MSDVKRYVPVDQWGQDLPKCMVEDDDGTYVLASDYDAIVAERDEYKAGFREAMTDHAATLERLADCERQRDEPCGFKGDEPTCLVASRLKARLAEEQRDAERYRWLRDDNAYAPEEMGICGRDELDKLCDSAIAKGTRLHCVRCGCRIGYINQLDGQQLCPHCAARYSAQATDNAPAQESK